MIFSRRTLPIFYRTQVYCKDEQKMRDVVQRMMSSNLFIDRTIAHVYLVAVLDLNSVIFFKFN